MNFTEIIKDFLINIANILILYLIVRTLVYKPVKKFLDARTERVAAALNDAKLKSDEAEKLKSDYEKMLSDNESLKVASVHEGEELGKQKAKDIVEQANDKAREIVEEARHKSELTQKHMLDDAQSSIADLTIEITEKILAREINDGDNRKIVNDFLSN